MPTSQVRLVLDIQEEILEDAGDAELWRLSRLRWLNSRIAFDDEIVPPYTPLVVRENTVSCLGRTLTIGLDGFPSQLSSYFTPEVTVFGPEGREILGSPIKLLVEDEDGAIFDFQGEGLHFTNQAPGTVAWESESRAGAFVLSCSGRMEFDGFVQFKVGLECGSAAEVKDIRLEIPAARRNGADT